MNFTSLPAPAAESLEDCSSGIAASARSRSIPTAGKSLLPDSKTEACPTSPSSPTFVPSTEPPGADELTSWLAGFPVRTFPLPARVRESAELDRDSGGKWRGSLARFDPDSSSWRTVQHSLLEDSESSSVTWPRSGMTAGGRCYLRPISVLRILGNVCGSSPMFLTPCAMDANPFTGGNLYQTATGTVRHMRPDGKSSNRGLAAQVMWPTPTVCGNYNRQGASATSGDGLATAVRTWPTPTASMHKGSSPASLTRKSGASRENDRLDHAVMASESGPLNPTWVEWLMGWPIGHTDLKPLGMDRFHEWRRQHSPCSPASSREAA